jgi:hypothetical protein
MSCSGSHLGITINKKNTKFQLKPNCPRMIIGRSSTNFLFFMPIGNPRWLPPQVIVLTQDHMGKIQKYILPCASNPVNGAIHLYGNLFSDAI